MTAKEFVEEVRVLVDEIERDEEEVERLRSAAMSITAPFRDDVVSGGGTSDKVGNMACCIMGVEQRLEFNRARLRDMAWTLWAYGGDVLHLRYVKRMRWKDIAERLGVSRQWAKHLENEEMEKLQKKLEKN